MNVNTDDPDDEPTQAEIDANDALEVIATLHASLAAAEALVEALRLIAEDEYRDNWATAVAREALILRAVRFIEAARVAAETGRIIGTETT